MNYEFTCFLYVSQEFGRKIRYSSLNKQTKKKKYFLPNFHKNNIFFTYVRKKLYFCTLKKQKSTSKQHQTN